MLFFTRSAQRARKNHTAMPSTNLSGGTVPNHVLHLTGRYLGCKQKLGHAVNDNLGLEDG
jgi:hypothetical protein